MAGLRKRIYRKKARVPRKRTIVRKALRKASNQNITKVVKRVLAGMSETKIVTREQALFPFTMTSATTSLAGNYIVCNPSTSTLGYTVTKGDDSNQRTGNRVTTKRLRMTYVINPAQYNVTTNPGLIPTHVIIHFFKYKPRPVGGIDALDTDDIFENGATATTYSGNLFDLTCRLNSDKFQYIARRVHKIGYAVNSNSGWTQPTVGSGQFPVNDFKTNVVSSIDLTKYCPKTHVFNENNNDCISKNIHMLIQCVNCNNSVNAATIQPIIFTSKMQFEYTDL